jgi:phage FluMu protein Com
MLPVPRPNAPRQSSKIRWLEMRCVHCGRLLQKIEQDALRPGKRLEIKCGHCKIVNYSVGRAASGRAAARSDPHEYALPVHPEQNQPEDQERRRAEQHGRERIAEHGERPAPGVYQE